MAEQEIDIIIARLEVKFKKAQKDLDDTKKRLDDLEKKSDNTNKKINSHFKKMGSSFAVVTGPLSGITSRFTALQSSVTGAGLAFTGIGIAIATVTVAITKAITAYTQFERQQLRVQTLLRSTGYAAGITQGQIEEMSRSIGLETLQSADGVREAAGVLLTFKKVSGDAFGRTLRVAADLSEVLGQSMKSSVLQLGKALEEPEYGLLALRRAGVSFTEQQKEMIKSMVEAGRQAEAMNMILTQIEGQVGGAGAGAAGGLAGAFDTLGEKLGLMFDKLGGNLDKLLKLSDSLNSISQAIDKVIDAEPQTALEAYKRLGEEQKSAADKTKDLLDIHGKMVKLMTFGTTNLSNTYGDLNSKISDTRKELNLFKKDMPDMMVGPMLFKDIGEKIKGKFLGDEVKKDAEGFATVLHRIIKPTKEITMWQKFLEKQFQESAAEMRSYGEASDDSIKVEKEQKEAVDKLLKSLRQKSATIGMSTGETQKYIIQQKLSKDLSIGNRDLLKKEIEEIQKKIKMMEHLKKTTGDSSAFKDEISQGNERIALLKKEMQTRVDAINKEVEHHVKRLNLYDELDEYMKNAEKNSKKRTRELEKERKKMEKLDNKIMASEGYARNEEMFKKMFERYEQLKTTIDSLKDSIASMFEDAIVEGAKFSDVIRQLEKEMVRFLIKTQVTQPLSNALSGVVGSFAQGIMDLEGSNAVASPSTGASPGATPATTTPSFRGGRGITVNNNFNVTSPTGMITQESQNQMANNAGMSLSRSMRRR